MRKLGLAASASASSDTSALKVIIETVKAELGHGVADESDRHFPFSWTTFAVDVYDALAGSRSCPAGTDQAGLYILAQNI